MARKLPEKVKVLQDENRRLRKELSNELESYCNLRKEFIKLYCLLKQITPSDCLAIEEAEFFMNRQWDLEDHIL